MEMLGQGVVKLLESDSCRVPLRVAGDAWARASANRYVNTDA
ncbi:MAG: hypothetical protein ACI909_002853 [Planctomycetota bacterium]|jgi:hypothetical protein